MIQVMHIITGLAADGAERMLFNLVTRMDRQRFTNSVVSLTSLGDLGEPLRQQGIAVRAIGLSKNVCSLQNLWQLRQILRADRPDLVQTWMYHADLLGGLAAQGAGIRRVLWGVHHCDLDRGSAKWSTRATARTCAQFSSWLPERVVFCSEASRAAHTRFGYQGAKSEFIPNGFDTNRFRPDLKTGQLVRSQLRVKPDSLLVGIIGRYHPHKDHSTFLAAAASIARDYPEIEFVLCGRNVTRENDTLWAQIKAAGIDGRTHMLGARDDVARILTALDIVVSSSRTEAFPLAIGEAMATGVPCVATDVGDSRSLVGDTGMVVPAQDAAALANGIKVLVESGPAYRQTLGAAARTRIETFFSLKAIVRRYEDLYSQMTKA